MKKKSKGFDPLGFTLESTALHAGTLMGTGLVYQLPSSPGSGKILSGIDTLPLIPRMHSIGGVFGSLRHLERSTKKKR